MQTNPFKPTAGKTPPTIIGREDVLEEFNEGLTSRPGCPWAPNAHSRRPLRNGQDGPHDEINTFGAKPWLDGHKRGRNRGTLPAHSPSSCSPNSRPSTPDFEPTVAGISIGSIDIGESGPSLPRRPLRQTITKNGNGLLITLDRFKTQSSMVERSPLRSAGYRRRP